MSRRSTLQAALFTLAVVVAAPCLQAQPSTAAAVVLFDEGRSALQRGELDVACAKFKESNRIGPALGTAFNLANCEEQRGLLATAWILFRQVAGQMKADDPRLAVANEHAASLEKRVPKVVLVADKHTPQGTRVRLGDIEFESASFGSAIPLDPGEHRATIRSPGAATRTATFTLTPGETVTLSLNQATSVSASSPSANARPSTPTEERVLGVQRSNALLMASGIGAAGLVVGTITGLLGLSAESRGNLACSNVTKTCSQQGYDANQRAKTMATISTVSFVVGVLGGGAATYLYFTAPTKGSADQTAIFGARGRW